MRPERPTPRSGWPVVSGQWVGRSAWTAAAQHRVSFTQAVVSGGTTMTRMARKRPDDGSALTPRRAVSWQYWERPSRTPPPPLTSPIRDSRLPTPGEVIRPFRLIRAHRSPDRPATPDPGRAGRSPASSAFAAASSASRPMAQRIDESGLRPLTGSTLTGSVSHLSDPHPPARTLAPLSGALRAVTRRPVVAEAGSRAAGTVLSGR